MKSFKEKYDESECTFSCLECSTTFVFNDNAETGIINSVKSHTKRSTAEDMAKTCNPPENTIYHCPKIDPETGDDLRPAIS